MSAEPSDAVTFSDLSRNPRAVAERARRLIAVLSDAAELAIDRTAHEVIAGWRATARIKADESLYPQALASTQGDFGPVQALG
jgi:hypothetical protein